MPPAETLVVDASVAVKWNLGDEEHADKATLLLTRFSEGKTDLLAPDYIRYEVPSAITVATQGRGPRIAQDQGKEAIEEFLNLGVRTMDSSELILEAYPLVHQYGCALYDALYLALAQRLTLPFITADFKLYRRIRHLPGVVWIGDYSPVDGE
ncbi:MAG: type II toxin-antitoxin system VapC family toxin [Dehalococcoidia bacterium]|nr:type II toxin-antitoxin system VapC family toxin [Dehalococcoidia bacterium]